MMNRIVAYNALIAEACANYCDEFDHGFYADDATFTLTIVSYNRNLEVVTCIEGGYLFDAKYYNTVEEVLDAVDTVFTFNEYGFVSDEPDDEDEFTMEDLVKEFEKDFLEFIHDDPDLA